MGTRAWVYATALWISVCTSGTTRLPRRPKSAIFVVHVSGNEHEYKNFMRCGKPKLVSQDDTTVAPRHRELHMSIHERFTLNSIVLQPVHKHTGYRHDAIHDCALLPRAPRFEFNVEIPSA